MKNDTQTPSPAANTPRLRTPLHQAWLAMVALIGTSALTISSVHAELPKHNISAGNINVIQNDTGNVATSVTLSLPISINDFRLRGSGVGTDTNSPVQSRGDYPIQVGSDPTSNFTNGILMCSVMQNGRDDLNTGTNTYYVSMIENQRTNAVDYTAFEGAYWINVNTVANLGGGNSPEGNVNVAAAWFPYTDFIGAFARNHGPNDELGGGAPGGFTNGGAMNQLIGFPALAIGTNFFDLGGGKAFVTLTNLGYDSRVDGIMLVSGAKNESANYGLGQANSTNGGWNIFIKDDGAAAAGTFEQDPLAFVFIPKTNTTVVSGRFLGNGGIEMFSGATAAFTVSSNAVGTYELKIPGYNPTNGVLIVSAEGGRTVNQDNIVSYQVNPAGDGWIIQSRDTPVGGLEAIPAAEPVASFVFIPAASPGYTVTPTNNLVTTEAGGQATFTVALHTQPTSDVVINLSSSDTTEGTVFPDTLTFNASDWNSPKIVTITGQDDALGDGSVAYSIVLAPAVSADTSYNNLNPDDVSVVNSDNEGGVTVSPTSGLTTTEGGGTATFTVRLNTQPSGDVTIGLSSGNTNEGTVSPASLTFNSSNWNSEQTATVTGVDDSVDDGNVGYTIVTAPASSSDSAYNNFNVADVSVINQDNDTASVDVSASGPGGLSVVEGGSATYTVVLSSQPAANVTVSIVSSDTVQGGAAGPNLTFTSSDWNTPKTVTVNAANDTVPDGSTAFTITNTINSSDSLYAAIAPITVSVTTLDNEAVITLPSGDAQYGIGQVGVGVDGRASIADPNSPTYNGGTLTVAITNNAAVDDRLEIRNNGTAAGQIGVSGNSVSYGGTAIATFTGGNGTTPLVISFNSASTPTAAQALLQSVTFRNTNSSPSLNRRAVSVVLVDGDGGTSGATTGVRLSLVRVADFQQGADRGYGIYTNADDCNLRQAAPNTPFPQGSGGGLFIDWPDPGVNNSSQMLLRFGNIFGDGLGQIPTNAVIVSAQLFLRVPPEDSNGSGDGSPLYRMIKSWNGDTETWTTMDNGVDLDGADALNTYDSQIGVADGSGATGNGTIWVSVLPDLLAWENGQVNNGWVLPGWNGNLDGTTILPSETAIIDYRPRLRVTWLPAGTASVSFRQGVNGYTNAVDTFIRTSTPDTNYASNATIFSDWSASTTGDNDQLLFRFDNIVGSAPGQIPSGATIHAAMFDLACLGNNAMGDGGQFFGLLQPWDITTTSWNSWNAGIQADGVEAVATATTSAGDVSLNPNAQGGYLSFEITSDVQAWVSGARPNYGFAILPWTNGGDGWGMSTSDSATETSRPQLRVYYTPNTAPTAISIGTITRGTSSVTIQFTGAANTTYSVQRVSAIGDTWGTIGSTTSNSSGVASFTDNTPPAAAAFYRISNP